MALLYWFESIRAPWLDTLMSLITRLGEEAAFMAAALFVYWCVDKRRGYYLLAVGFTGTLLSQWLKIVCRVPRPWVRDPGFTIVETAREGAGGYSFPSGHTQAAVGWMGGAARSTRRRWVRPICIVLMSLTALSRMYLGVHTPADVGTAFALALALVFLLYPLVESTLWFPGRMYWLLGGMVLFSGAFTAFVELFPFPADVDGANLSAAVKNAWSMLGAAAGMLAVCVLDSRALHFSTRAPWWGQAVKLGGGLAVVAAVKSLLKAPLLALCGGHEAAHALRYFLLVLAAGGVWPITFRFFEKYEK